MNPAKPEVRDQAALDRLAIDTIRFLAADAVERAQSGHPGMPMGMADVAYALWMRHLRHHAADPAWPGRDRFVLSAGHGSMLLYAMLHLTGYDLPMEELRRFRQLGSRTPGHPEHGLTPGVETTTGPLGQGLGNAVGMAVALRMLAARFNDASFAPVQGRVFGICGDGDLMEGVSAEAASLAGHWGLGHLNFVYDDNHITIEGDTALAFSEDVAKRFEAYGWHVQKADPYDPAALGAALERAVAETARPSLVITRSHIAYGAPAKQDTAAAHGEPLGEKELAAARRALGWPAEPPFLVPAEVRARFAERTSELAREHDAWQRGMRTWRERDPRRAAEWDALIEKRIPDDIYARLVAAAPGGDAATRVHGGAVLQIAAELVPSLVGGSADLEPSTKTRIRGAASITRDDFSGRNFHFGVREHGMGAIVNGIALTEGFIPYGSSFLVFTDYARPAIRLSALMKLQTLWVFTHDSVFVGEDGPTHEPVEHLAALRMIPNLLVIRPADGLETAAAWGMALERRDGPTMIVLSRQKLPALARAAGFDPTVCRAGGYVLREGAPGAITLIATGSEVGLAVAAADALAARGIATRVVSMPAPERFLAQPRAVQEAVLPPAGRRVSIEAGITSYWRSIVGPGGLTIGIDRYGESAPLADIQRHFGFTPEQVAEQVAAWAG
jgi:transketolase